MHLDRKIEPKTNDDDDMLPWRCVTTAGVVVHVWTGASSRRGDLSLASDAIGGANTQTPKTTSLSPAASRRHK
ncbi:unnamed protein product [Nippostrongylus brasiliensis]|uniref:Uncharacterized protein n=1 Tax=Nippostrongylus brasiliensis TaxID=27835 RepID=A0A0N4XZA2_NIPBR|nr:unnamed protein product [Nippostrongylus brasiliensis]